MIAAINDGAKVAQTGAFAFALVELYLLATAFSAIDEDLLLDRTLAITQLGAQIRSWPRGAGKRRLQTKQDKAGIVPLGLAAGLVSFLYEFQSACRNPWFYSDTAHELQADFQP